jgi:hypothetical protein
MYRKVILSVVMYGREKCFFTSVEERKLQVKFGVLTAVKLLLFCTVTTYDLLDRHTWRNVMCFFGAEVALVRAGTSWWAGRVAKLRSTQDLQKFCVEALGKRPVGIPENVRKTLSKVRLGRMVWGEEVHACLLLPEQCFSNCVPRDTKVRTTEY